jgi:hypothetical protein
MHEAEFRDRVRAAFGEAPDERAATQRAAAVLHRPPAREERAGPPRAMALVAGALAVLVLAGLLGPRLLRAAHRPAVPAAGGAALTPSPSPSGSDLATCRVPVVVTDAHFTAPKPGVDPLRAYPSPLPRFTAGFVSPATGRFVADPTAQGGTMPFRRNYVNDEWSAQSYDPVLKRWLSASRNQISPDGHSYVYVTQHPLATGGKGSTFDSSTLSVYDVTTGRNRDLWTSSDQISPASTWEADGIHTSTIPWSGGHSTYWLVNPVTGAVAPDPGPPANPLAAATLSGYGMNGGGGFGTDGAGHPILLDGSRNPGAHQEYFVGGPNGQRIVIHDGAMGDAFDFDPSGFTVDGDRLWAANFDATALWLWTEKDGLKRIPLTGIAQRDGFITPKVVGPCR